MRVLCYAWLHPPYLCCAALPPLPGLQVQAPHVCQVGAVSIEATMHEQLVPYQRCCMAAAVRRPRACRPVQRSAAQGGDTILRVRVAPAKLGVWRQMHDCRLPAAGAQWTAHCTLC